MTRDPTLDEALEIVAKLEADERLAGWERAALRVVAGTKRHPWGDAAQIALDFFREHPGTSFDELCRANPSRTSGTFSEALRRLVRRKVVQRTGPRGRGRYFVVATRRWVASPPDSAVEQG